MRSEVPGLGAVASISVSNGSSERIQEILSLSCYDDNDAQKKAVWCVDGGKKSE